MSGEGASEALIRRLSGEYELASVRYLTIEQAHISSIASVLGCTSLVELSLARNAISVLSGIHVLVSLERLNVSFNDIRCLDGGIQGMVALHTLDMRGNRVAYVEDVAPALGMLPSLRCLSLQSSNGLDSNPVCAHPAYANSMFNALPQLAMLDGCHIQLVTAEREIADQLSAIQPELSGFPPILEDKWLRDSDLLVEMQMSLVELEDGVEEVARLLAVDSQQCLDNADAALLRCSNLVA